MVFTQLFWLVSISLLLSSNVPRLLVKVLNKVKSLKSIFDSLFQNLKDSLNARREHLAESEKAHQFLYDCNEAEAWMSEQELYMMQVCVSYAE